MKPYLTIIAVACFLATGSRAAAQTIDWGSPMFSDLVDSTGKTLDSGYTFEIGAFTPNFTPDQTNVTEWAANWHTFDSAAYNKDLGYFTSSVQMAAGGQSSNPLFANLGLNFQDLHGYLWIRNSDTPLPGVQWLLARAASWIFPTYTGCCANTAPLQWSVSDLAPTTPVYGKQGEIPGAGVFTDSGTHTLQTYTFVPEPSTPLLVILAGATLALRRRRVV